MENISQRIKLIADNECIKITQLEAKLGASKGVLSRSIANNTDIQSKWVTLLVENYPQYNSDWLLTGHGSMLKDGPPVQAIDATPGEAQCRLCVQKDKVISKLEHIIERNEQEIDWLRQQIDQRDSAVQTKRQSA
jgi:hypothetical protein